MKTNYYSAFLNYFSAILVLFLSIQIGMAQTYSFTNAGATGQYGPTQGQCDAAYGPGVVTVNTQGMQEWVVPTTGNYSIQALGAAGGVSSNYGSNNGFGASMKGEFFLTAGQVIKIAVGQVGGSGPSAGAGGGGTFVVDNSNSPFAIAGGGGGTEYQGYTPTYQHGSTGLNGQNTNQSLGGVNGNGGQGNYSGNGASGGGGLLTNGTNGSYGSAGLAFINGAIGGNTSWTAVGGFGGGGGTHGDSGGGGGGGGYSGGAGGYHSYIDGNGGGGGSINNGTNQVNIAGSNNGMGSVVITLLCIPNPGSLVATISNLGDINASCETTPPVPTATNSCGVTINGTSNVTFPITGSGTTVITWTYNDGVNTITQNQNVILTPDTENPVIICPPNITSTCDFEVSYPGVTMTDNCGSLIVGNQTFNYTGSIQTFTVPAGVTTLTIDAAGAQGGVTWYSTEGGKGAKMVGDVSVTPGQVLQILVGQQGATGSHAGGGGGSFVVGPGNTPLVIAGGGGGAPYDTYYTFGLANADGSILTNGNNGSNGVYWQTAGIGGTNGNGGAYDNNFYGTGAGGGGLLTNGQNPAYATGGFAFVNGGNGGNGCSAGNGGFGGGGGAEYCYYYGSGGGGGYSGGGGGAYYGCGGGGGSFNAGTNQNNIAGFQTGNGYVTISYNQPNFGTITQTAGYPSGATFPPVTTTNTFVATDFSGNTATCSFTVTPSPGAETTPPVIVCPADIVSTACNNTVTYPAVTVTDNCSVLPSTEVILIPYSNLINLPYSVGCTGNDYSNDPSNGDIGFSWNNTNPNVPASVTIEFNYDLDCYGGQLGTSLNGNASGMFTPPYDCWGCQANTIFTFNPNPATYNPNGSNTFLINTALTGTNHGLASSSQLGGYARVTVTYAGDLTLTQTAGLPSGSVFPYGTTTNTFVATDGLGNTSTNSFTVTVGETEAPIIDIPSDIFVCATTGTVVNYATPTVTDNCGTLPTIPGYTVYGANAGNTYFISNNSILANDQSNQQTIAATHNAQLLTINNAAENTYIQSIANSYGDIVIPFTDQNSEGTFIWTGGNGSGYTNWNSGEPNGGTSENYTQMYYWNTNAEWNDIGNFWGRYIIEMPTPVPPVITQTAGLPSGSTFPVGVTTNTFTATDAAGNVGTSSFTVTIGITDQNVTPATQSISLNDDATISIASSEVGIDYYLRNDADNSIVDGPIAGTGSGLTFNTGALAVNSTFNVFATTQPEYTGLNFDGVDDYVTMGNVPLGLDQENDDFTLEFWVRTTQTGSPATLISRKIDGAPIYWNIDLEDGIILANAWWEDGLGLMDNPQVFSNTPINDGQWHHLAFSRSSSNLSIIIDGVIDASGGWGAVFDNGNDLYFGTPTGGFFDGDMDDVRIWDYAKSAIQVSNSMNSCLTAPQTGLLFLATLDDGAGSSTVLDEVTSTTGSLLNMDPSTVWIPGQVTCGASCSTEMSQTANVTICNPAPTNVAGTYTSGTINHTDGTTQVYNYDNCITIGEITDAASGNVLGNTTMSTTVASSILTTNPDGYVYGRRSYSAAVASNGPATLKIYFTQADFDQYNANATNFLSLPTSGNNADPNKQFFRIATVVGGVHGISGSLGTNLNWNGNYWELTLPVTSINGAEYFFATMPSCSAVAVNNLAATNVTTDAVTATWSSVVTTPTWGWYSLQYRVVGAPTWTNAGTANNPATSKFINGLLPATNYEMQIRRHCSSQSTGPWSASVLFTTLGGGCGSPMILNTPTVTTSSVTTTWTAVSGAAWYEFQYKTAASGTWINAGTLSASATSKLFSGLTSGTAYNFRGRTYCPSGTPSPWSIVLNATTSSSAAGCSLPPVITATTINATNATITWPAVSGASWYELRYSAVSASGPWTSGGTANAAATSKVYSGLTQNTTYYFQARTYCANGTPSAWGATQFTTITAVGCELPPVLTATSVLATTATITWPSIAGASYFEYRYKQTVSGTWISAGTGGAAATSKTLTGLAAGTQYDFQARTFCANGLPSAWSTTLQFTTAMAMPLQPKPGSDVADDKAIDNSNIDVNVYPNPTSDLVNIETIFEQANTSILVKVIDMNGRIVLEANAMSVEGKNTIQLNLANLNVGIYNLELYNNDELIDRAKVIKTN